ncbi:RDD family protein [Reyranella sp. CPCC 100927]|nr:RDD family protein [Reyranella sp. CPCC 100927]
MQGPTYGGFWIRFVAYVIDAVILSIVGWIVRLLLRLIMGVQAAVGTPQFDTVMITSGLVGLIVSWLYFALQESSESGATVGKRVLGLRVLRGDGTQLTFARATGRFLGKFVSSFILMIGYIMAGFTERKRALHDMIADTVVIKT